MVFMIVDLT